MVYTYGLLKSQTAKLLAVRRVTQDNQGKNMTGADGIKSLSPPQRLTVAIHFDALSSGRPTRRSSSEVCQMASEGAHDGGNRIS